MIENKYGITMVGTTRYKLLERVQADYNNQNCAKYSALAVNEENGMTCSLRWNKWPPQIIFDNERITS